MHCEIIFHTFKVSEFVALQLVSIKYCRLALMLLFFCFFLNSSKMKTKKREYLGHKFIAAESKVYSICNSYSLDDTDPLRT